MKMKKLTIYLFSLTLVSYCFGQDVKTININKQQWMASNLSVSRFRNGDPIPEAKTAQEFISAGINGKPAWCYYNNDSSNNRTYGKLYNFYAVTDPRGLAPIGFHIPSIDEWRLLISFLGGDTLAGKKLKNTNGWNDNGNGNNENGFSGLPGGNCMQVNKYKDEGKFSGLGDYGAWWSSTLFSVAGINKGYYVGLSKENDKAYIDVDLLTKGRSVRCIRD
jgi:uncharacterized protein (TIGR02145 family)